MQSLPSLYQDHRRVFCNHAISQLKGKYMNDWAMNMRFTNLCLARYPQLHLSQSNDSSDDNIMKFAFMEDNRYLVNTFRQLLTKTDKALIISKAAMFFLGHLCDLSSTRKDTREYLHIPEVERKYRTTRPWRWHRRRSYHDPVKKVFVKKYWYRRGPGSCLTYGEPFNKVDLPFNSIYPLSSLPWMHFKFNTREIFNPFASGPLWKYHDFLGYLVIILPHAARFLPLIHLAKTKPFAPMSRIFPNLSVRARRAIAAYLDRVENDNEKTMYATNSADHGA